MAAEILKAAIDAGEGKLPDEVAYVAGSTGSSVKIAANSQRTD